MTTDQVILIAEDEESNIKLYLDFFIRKPFKVIYARDGREVMDLIKVQVPDLIIMDWNMPVMSGLEATKRLQEQGLTDELPVIMATGVMTSSANLKEALEAGAYDFVRKPMDTIELEARISSALRLSNSFRTIKRLLKTEKLYLEGEIENRDKELSMAMTIQDNVAKHHQNIVKKIGEVSNVSPEPVALLLREVINELEEFAKVDRTWEKFQTHFNKVNPKFYERLEEHSKQLTNMEKRVCTYVKMGMGNKEIAQVNHVEVSTVKKTMARIKRKLKVGDGMTFREFIADL